MGNSILLIVVGLLTFYLVISDKWKYVEDFAYNIAHGANEKTKINNDNPTTTPKLNGNNLDDNLDDLMKQKPYNPFDDIIGNWGNWL